MNRIISEELVSGFLDGSIGMAEFVHQLKSLPVSTAMDPVETENIVNDWADNNWPGPFTDGVRVRLKALMRDLASINNSGQVDHIVEPNKMIPSSKCKEAYLKLYEENDDDLAIFEDGWEAAKEHFALHQVPTVPSVEELREVFYEAKDGAQFDYRHDPVDIGILAIHALLNRQEGR